VTRQAAAMLLVLALAVPAWAGPAYEPGSLRLPETLWAGGSRLFGGDLKARVSMRTVKHARVLAERVLALPAGTAGQSVHSWGQGPRMIDLPGSGRFPEGFNEARLDYVTADPARCGMLGFVVAVDRGDGRDYFVSDPLETVDRISPVWADGPAREAVPVAGADWTSKGLRYQLSRLLDRDPDDVWRISQDGLSTFVQRRFRKNLVDVGAIDVVLLRGQDVQVNLVVSLDPDGKGRTVLDWYALPKRTFDLGDGRSILRLYVGRHLRELAPGAKAASLKEMALMFFRQNRQDVEKDRNVEKILFVPSGLPGMVMEKGLPRDLPARAREVFAGRGELAANLEILYEPEWKDAEIASLAVVQFPQDPEQQFDQTLENARLVKVAPRRDVPAILAAAEDRCKSFGAECDPDSPDGFVSQDPLWNLDFSGLTSPEGASGAVYPVLAGGLFASGDKLTFEAARDGLSVECVGGGEGAAFTLETGAAFKPEPGKRYGVWLELGRSRAGLAGVEAEVYGGGESARIRVKPGLAAWFKELPAAVEGVRLRFTSQAPEMAVTLRKAVVQTANPEAPGTGLFEARFLFEHARQLEAARSGPASVSFQAGKPGFQPQWLSVDVTVPAWTVNDSRPGLVLSAGGVARSVPLPARKARVAFLLPRVMAEAVRDGASELGLSLSGGAPGAVLEVSGAVLSGQSLSSWPRILGSEALAELGGEDRALEGLDAGGAARIAAGAWWLPMGKAGLPPGSQTVRFMKNPWLEVEALMVERGPGPAMTALARNGSGTAGDRPSKGGKALAMAGLMSAAVLAWLAGRNGRGALACSRLAGWLARDRREDGTPLPARGWIWLAGGLAAVAVVLGPDAGRILAGGVTALAIPLWRACRVRVEPHLPVLAKSAPVHYCTGFLAAAALSAIIRLSGAAPVSELTGLAGLWLFLAALVTSGSDRLGKSDSARSAP